MLGNERCDPGFAAGHCCAFEEAFGLWVDNTGLRGLCPCHILLLDFLPLKCDACEQIFCTDHITYAQHNCTSAYKKVSAESRSHPPSCMELLSFSSHWS